MLTTDFVPGTPIWLDLAVRDLPAAGTFYGGLFGWDLEITGPETGGYGILRSHGKSVAALAPLTDGSEPAWTLYFATTDADATTKAVRDAGGTVLFEPMDVMTMGRMAVFADPAGAGFAIWQPGDNPGLEVVQDNAALCWTELYTPDRDGAAAFYHVVLGWDYQDESTPEGVYSLAYPSGDPALMHAGLMGVAEQNPALWQPYIGVEDCDASAATAVGLGATTLMEPQDIPDVGRIAMFADPFGARFAIIKGLLPDQ